MDDTAVEGTGTVRAEDRDNAAESGRWPDLHIAGAGREQVDDQEVSEASAEATDLDARLEADLDIEAEAVMAELIAAIPQPIQPHEFTVEQFAEKSGLVYTTAHDHLNRLVKDGNLIVRKLRGGKNAYSKPRAS